MQYEVRQLDESHRDALRGLWSADARAVYPHASTEVILPEDFLAASDPQAENVVVQGAFARGRLVAAIKWGRRKLTAPVCDLGNLYPGDGVIFWLGFDDEGGAEELLMQAEPGLGKRIYAFPEQGDMAGCTVFSTGMLSLGKPRLTAFLERHGFMVPAAAEWGPQERICFHLAVPERGDLPVLPPGFRVECQQDALAVTLLLHLESGLLIGRSYMRPARVAGKDVPEATIVGWLGVDAPYRGQGLGRALLDMQVHHARRQGMNHLYLTTHAGRPAWKLYQRAGFMEVDRRRSYVCEAGPNRNSRGGAS